MFKFLTLKPESFGLDVSDLSLRIVKFEKKLSGIKLASYGETAIDPGVIRHGSIKKEADLIKFLKKALAEVKGKKLDTKYVIASLPEEKAFLEVIQMPHLPLSDLKAAVIYEAENYIPLPVEEVYLDSQALLPVDGNNSDTQDVLITALPKKIVDPYVKCFKAAGLKPLAFEIESLAVARAIVKDEFTPNTVLIVDLGMTRTSFNIFSGDSLRFTFYSPISSQKLTQILSDKMKVDLDKAEKLKTKYGLKAKAVFDTLNPYLDDLVKQTKKYLDYYQGHSSRVSKSVNGKVVKKVLLCGGGANLKGLTDFLSIHLNLPVEVGNPWINILPKDQKETPKLTFEESLGYTTALGLALRGLNDD